MLGEYKTQDNASTAIRFKHYLWNTGIRALNRAVENTLRGDSYGSVSYHLGRGFTALADYMSIYGAAAAEEVRSFLSAHLDSVAEVVASVATPAGAGRGPLSELVRAASNRLFSRIDAMLAAADASQDVGLALEELRQ